MDVVIYTADPEYVSVDEIKTVLEQRGYHVASVTVEERS